MAKFIEKDVGEPIVNRHTFSNEWIARLFDTRQAGTRICRLAVHISKVTKDKLAMSNHTKTDKHSSKRG